MPPCGAGSILRVGWRPSPGAVPTLGVLVPPTPPYSYSLRISQRDMRTLLESWGREGAHLSRSDLLAEFREALEAEAARFGCPSVAALVVELLRRGRATPVPPAPPLAPSPVFPSGLGGLAAREAR